MGKMASMKFTIRDMLWLTVVVAMGIGWWVSLARCQKELALEHRDLVQGWRLLAEYRRQIAELKKSAEPADSGPATLSPP